MAKRSADKELTHDNWDQEQDEEEAGVFRSASRDVLEKREIKKAKRRGVTDDKGGAGAFKGFSFGVTTPAAGSTGSKSISFTIQPASAAAAASVTSTTAVSKSGSPKPSSGDLDTESQYRRSLRTLNESVLRWIDDHIKTNPYCILTPVFNDYEKYIKELDRDFPQSSDNAVGKIPVATTAAAGFFSFPASSVGPSSSVSSCSMTSNPQTSTSATVVPGLFGSATTAANSDGKPLAPPTSTTAATAGFSAPGLWFGAQDSKASTGFGCSTVPSVGATSSGLINFGAQPSKEATSPTPGFIFGAPASKEPATSLASKEANSPTSGFSFGAQSSKEANSPPAAFSFGTQPSKEAISKASGFSFSAQPSKEATPNTSGFTFGSQPSKDANAPTAGFSFSAQPSKEATSNTSGTTFGAQPSKEAIAPTGGFSFSPQPSKEANASTAGFSFSAQPSKEANASTAGFSFSAQPSKEASAPTAGFSFSAQPSKEATSTPASGFRFNIQPAKEAASSSAPADASTSAPKEGGDDDTYVPPKAEVVEIQEDGAFYTVRCKLYYKIDNKFKERGIGNLYLKPCGEKTQLLVRAGTALGNILLNIMLNKNIPANRQGKDVMMFCIPNPPVDEKKPNDKTPVCTLLRVKDEEAAETLLQQINDHKV